MNDKVQQALEARKKRKEQENQAKQDKLSSAVEAYKKRKQSNAKNAASTFAQKINDEIEKTKNVSEPSWGKGALESALNATKDSTQNIKILIQEVEAYKNYFDEETYTSLSSAVNQLKERYDSYLNVAEVREQFESADAYNSWYKKYKEQQAEREAVLGAEDYESSVETAKSFKNPDLNKAEKGGSVVNKVTYIEDNSTAIGVGEVNGGGSNIVSYHMSFMTDDEKNIYHYYFGRGEYDKADQYLASLEETLKQRHAGVMADKIDGNAILETVFAFGAGLDSFASGMRSLDNLIMGTEADPTTTTQYTYQQLQSNNTGVLGAVTNVANSVGNMLPSILVGTVTGGAGGTVLFGASAAGNGYSEMKELGYDEWQARGYGLLVGASETALQYLLGGISSLGGKVTGNAINNFVSKIDNAVAKVAINYGGKMASEGLEEAIQTAIEPYFKELVTGEDFASATWDDILYSALLGAVTSGFIEGVGGGIASYQANKNAKAEYSGIEQDLVMESLDINPNNAFAQKMQTKLDSGKTLSGRQINQLVQQNETSMYSQDLASIQSAAAERLVALGETSNVDSLAKVLAKQASGEKLSRSEANAIKNSKYGQRVANELNPENITSGQYSSAWAEQLNTERINPEEYSKYIADAELATETPVTEETTNTLPKTEKSLDTEALTETVSNSSDETQEATETNFEPTETASDTVAEETAAEEESTITLAEASAKYGAQAQAMVHTYTEGQDVAKYDAAYQVAYDMGKSGVSLSYAMNSETTSYLSEKQRELAYEAGKAASDTAAKEQDAKNKKAANGKTGRRKGTVKGEGVKIEDLRKSFNDTQNTAYKVLSTTAEATGVDIVLYKSETDEKGNFIGSQGKFNWSEDKIYIDINAGLKNIKDVNDLAKYAMLRTFSHEFTHFIEKWNPIWYNEFRKVVFDTLTERGENVHDLIEEKQAATPGMTYEKASREVVAEAMTDILPDATFVETLATKHKTVFEKLLEKIKDFLADIKAYFSTIGHNRSKEANALKEQVGEAVHYVENIVKLFDKVAIEAVENYQTTVATKEVTVSEFDEDGNPIYETIENRKSIEPINNAELKKIRAKSVEEFGLNEKQASVLDFYVMSLAYALNKKLNSGNVIDGDRPVIDTLTEALQKFPVFEGRTYRNLKFENEQDYNAFLEENSNNSIVRLKAFTSTSKKPNGYPLFGKYVVHMVFDGIRGRDIADTYGVPRQQEVLFLPGTQYVVNSVSKANDGNVIIFVKEIVNNEVQVDNGNLGIGESELDRDAGSNRAIPEGEKHDNVRVLGDGRRSENAGAGRTEIHDADTRSIDRSQTEVKDDVYERLRIPLANLPRFSTSGFLFRIYKNGETWQGHIDKVNESEGGYPVSDARGLHYKSEIFTNRQDAIDDIVAVAKNNKLLEPRAEKTETPKEEVNQNGTENADNRETVQQPDTDRSGDPQVLEGLQTEDVQGNVPRGDSVGDPVERGQETRRDGDSTDNGTGTRSRSSDGDSQSGDLRRNDELTPEAAEKLHEEVTEQIAQQSTELPKGRNFVIGDSLSLPKGEKARYKANIEAIRLVKQLEAEGRYATEAEQITLSKYVGWGGIANAFDERKSDWSKEYKELKELLTKEEYELARGSTLNAHYTDISVIKAMYDGLRQLGFNGGRMMEPSSGVGNFVGAMPEDMSAKVKSWTMVELDSITGLIAKYLYPNADVRIQGFEKANIPNNLMDVIISNVPFGDYPIADKTYPKRITKAIHNYFFAKSLDKVRPGGIVMFITSSYTMNAKEEAVREYIMQRADLLGAIRLPDTAFKGNAGTEVVTDILILKKREANTPYAGEDFLSAPWTRLQKESYNGAYINSYFNNHPEMVLGTATMDGSMYRSNSLTYKALEGKGSLADQIRKAFSHIKGKMDYPAQKSPEKTNFAVERASKKTKQDGFVAKDGKIYQNKDGDLVEQTVTPKVAERIKGMLEIRDAAKVLMNAQQQGLKESEIKKARANLNKLYDAFVKKNGFLNAPANKTAFAADPDRYSLFALENWNPDAKKATKADIFSKNTIAPNRTVTSAKDVTEGLIVSVNQTGGVDVPLIAALTRKSVPDVTRELLDSRQAFKNRNGQLETAETYLSGNVRAKLRDAEALAPMDEDYEKNVEALKAVIPEDVPYQDIFVNPGTPWIPSSVYSDFAAYMLGGRNNEWKQDVDVTRNASTGNFTVELKSYYLKTNAANTQKWGTPRRSFLELFDAMLNSKSVVIRYKLDDGTTVVDKDATAAANEKIENITKEFQDWLWRDEKRRTELATLYNETFNSVVTPKYNGDNLSVNGANAMKPLRPHQRNAVQRVISSGGNTLLAHKVGAGKTYEMAASAMKLKELGLVKKPMFAVPKSLVAQWGTEFIDFFPTAKLLVAEASDFTAANRKVFMNRIANGDYDAVIVSYEQFEKLPISDDFARELYQEEMDSVIAAIKEAKAEKGAKAMSIKDLEKKRKTLQAKIDKLTDKAKDEGNIDFEQLGVDSLFIDEAHNFKNLFYTTSMTNVSGLGNKDGSKRAFDLYTKVRYLQKLNGGKGIVFATATPVMNSMSEMYIMQKYLQPDLLNQLGLSTFDAWAKQFGEVVNGVEIKPSGQGYRVKQSFSRFKNMSELQLLFRNFADVLTDIPGLKIPKMKGGAVQVVVCEPGEFQKNYMKELEKRADNVKNVDPSVDNMLKITSDGRKISYTQRMIEPTLPYEEGCKIYRAADNVVRVYNESTDIKGTQIVFLDMATPKGKSKTDTTDTDDSSMDMESAKLYDDLRARLMQGGIPAKEIAFIHDADTDQKKKKLFADVNDGKVRVLIGSTGKMGVGMNAQKRIVAIHHLDAPWRPGDVEQRNGRAFRQGNINDEVENFTYVTEGSFDARLWDILERKQNFINQVMNGESVGRETEDTGEVTLSAAEVKALASGSPLIMEQVQLDTDIKKLESLYRAHRSSIRAAKDRLEKDRGTIGSLERQIELGKADMKATKDTYSEGKFSIKVGKQTFTEKKDAGVALMAEATAKADFSYATIGSFAGFEVRVIKTTEGIKGVIAGKQGYSFNTYPNNTTFMINHLISVVESISERVTMWEKQLEETKADMAEQEKLIGEPFAKQAELDEKRKRYTEVMEILNPKEEQSLDSVAEDTVQEQSRAYLDEETAPTFYSYMGKVIDEIKSAKMGANGVVSYLKGKGVKDEEIKWSGIEAFLEGKKSVSKTELQEFVAGSQLQIEEEMSGTATFIADDGNTYKSEAAFRDAAYAIADKNGIDRNRVKFVIDTEYDMDAYAYVGHPNNSILTAEVSEAEGTSPRWSQYKLDGGENYREIVFKMPNSSYSNQMMRTHWGNDAEGVLAHTRIQDLTTADGKKMLFVEEIQSDWHNRGHLEGYRREYKRSDFEIREESGQYRLFAKGERTYESMQKKANAHRSQEEILAELIKRFERSKSLSDKHKADDAPFRNTYHEYVLKRLIRMAAEGGYDTIGWTPANIQSDRWSDEYAEGYRIEYDQDIPKFLRKYGKKWGAKVGKTSVKGNTDVWSMDITDSMKESVLYEGQVQYQQRTDTLTDREVLEMAAHEVKVNDLTQAEQDALTIFQDRLSKLKDLEEKRAEQGRLYKEQQFGVKPDRSAAAETLNRMHTLDDQIKKATSDVLSVEEKEVLKRVLQKARKVVVAEERQHGQEMLSRWRDRRNNAAAIKKYRDRIRGDVDELSNWILKPDNKDIVKHVPDVLKNTVIPFLSSINFMSKRALKGGNATVSDKEFIKRLDALKSAIKSNIDVHGMYSGYNDLPPNFMDDLENIIKTSQALVDKSSGEFIINQMTSEELKSLSKVVRFLKKYITQINRFHYNAMYQHVYEAGDDSIEFLKELDNAGSHTGGLSNFLFWQQIRPAYAFERFGKGGEAIYDGLRRGQAKLAFNTKEIESFTNTAYTDKEVKAWEEEIKTFRLGADNVKMPVSYIMGLYELYKDPDGKRHIVNEGIRVATYTNKGKKISDVGHILTVGELNQILGSLTPRQIEVADSLQKYMAEQGAKWGNYVSVARFGEELFTNKNYYPISSDGRHLSATADEHPSAASLYALLNMSFTKSRNEEAKNRVVIYSIFDVFANHMASMAQYNAMALPILDALKWFNYKQVFIDDQGNKTVIANVREQMDRVYGVPEETRPGKGKDGYAQSFVMNIIKAFNGTEAQGTPNDGFWLKALHRYNIAQVAYNFRVVVQQPMAITRAGMLLDYRSIMKCMKLKPSAIKQNIEEMQKYSGIAAWKSLGFYDVNISRGLTKLIKHDSGALDKIDDVGMWGAEKADLLTWAAMWSAAKEEVKKKQRLTPESEDFYEAVAKLFEDVIYKTQVVDSVLTKNEYMRDKGFGARMTSSFMSEPVTNASMLIDAIDKYNLDLKRGMSKRDAWQKNGKTIGRRLYVYAVGAVILAAVQSVADAWRDDDDDYEEWYEKWLEALNGNLADELNLFNKLPVISDVYEVIEAIISPLLKYLGVDVYSTTQQTAWGQIAEYGTNSAEIILDKIINGDTNYTWYGGIYKLLQAVSGATGLPMASATREIITFWNNTVGTFAPSLKLKSYEPSELAEIRYAYEDGYLTDEEATALLLEKGLVDNENEAYFTIQGWEAGGEYSRYDQIYDAIRNGGSITEAMNELTSHGYAEEDVLSQVKSQIGKWYQEGDISKSQAVNMLNRYFDMSDEEITATVNKWSSVVVTGIKYDEIDDEFMEGNITKARAIEMYVRYGGMTKEKATEKVAVLAFVKEHPETEGISYAAVNGYNTYCEPYGVPADTFYEAWKHKNSLSGEIKAPMMEYINSLSLSNKQKDSLYFAFGWKESKLHEAPWH